MATIQKKFDPPPVSRPMFEKNFLSADWHRWFQAVHSHLSTLAAQPPTDGVGGFDGGRATTIYNTGSTLDLGGAA
jgi:hypothetical protein